MEYSFDYCFSGDEFGYKLTILSGKEKVTGMNFATAVPTKGASCKFASDKTVEFMASASTRGGAIESSFSLALVGRTISGSERASMTVEVRGVAEIVAAAGSHRERQHIAIIAQSRDRYKTFKMFFSEA